jgi:hypothetical protein
LQVATGMWLTDMHCWCDGIGDWPRSMQFWEVANQEVDLLSQSDHHSNVVRYYYKVCGDVLARCVRDSYGGGAQGAGLAHSRDTQHCRSTTRSSSTSRWSCARRRLSRLSPGMSRAPSPRYAPLPPPPPAPWQSTRRLIDETHHGLPSLALPYECRRR